MKDQRTLDQKVANLELRVAALEGKPQVEELPPATAPAEEEPDHEDDALPEDHPHKKRRRRH